MNVEVEDIKYLNKYWGGGRMIYAIACTDKKGSQ